VPGGAAAVPALLAAWTHPARRSALAALCEVPRSPGARPAGGARARYPRQHLYTARFVQMCACALPHSGFIAPDNTLLRRKSMALDRKTAAPRGAWCKLVRSSASGGGHAAGSGAHIHPPTGQAALNFRRKVDSFGRMSDRNRLIGRCCYGLSRPGRIATTGECWNPWYFAASRAIAAVSAPTERRKPLSRLSSAREARLSGERGRHSPRPANPWVTRGSTMAGTREASTAGA
jgi:hypothetical protein